MIRKLLFLWIAAALALAPVASVFAQSDAPPVFCGELGEADCQLLNDSRAAMENLTAGASNFQVAGTFEDLGGALSGEFTYGQETRFNVEPETLARVQEVRAMDEAQLAELIADPEAYTAFIVELLNGLDLAQTITITLSDELRASVSGLFGFEVPEDLEISYVLKDGVIYVNLGALAELVPSLSFLAGWTGVSLPDAIALIFDEGLLTPPDDPADFQSGLLIPGLAYTGTGLLGDDQRSAMFDAHMAVTRDGEERIDGVETARIVTELNFIGLLADPDVQLWLIDVFGEELMASLGIAKDKLGGLPFVLNMAGPALFNELDYSLVQNIGLDDAYLYRNEVDLAWDMTRVARAFGRNVDGRVYVSFVTTNDNSEFNTAEVEKPLGALVLPLGLIMQLMEGMNQ
jgi:hypothetical protein